MDSFLDEDKGTVAIDVIQEAPEMETFGTGAFDKSMFYKESNDDEVVVLLSGDTHTSEYPTPQYSRHHHRLRLRVVQKVPEVDPELVPTVCRRTTSQRSGTGQRRKKGNTRSRLCRCRIARDCIIGDLGCTDCSCSKFVES